MIGRELAYSPDLNRFERAYVMLFGAPINGLRIRLRRILPELTGAPRRVLDAGCGRGIFTIELAKRFPGAQVVGLDRDRNQLEKNLAMAAAGQIGNVEFVEGDVTAMPYDGEFDLVLSVDNLEHLEDDRQGIFCLARAARAGGRVVIHVPGYRRRWPLIAFRTNFDVPGHYRPGYHLEDICKLVEHAGLHVDKAYYTYGWWETMSNNISFLVTGAEAKNRVLYAILFPILNAMSWFGRKSRPKLGAGVMVQCVKPEVGE